MEIPLCMLIVCAVWVVKAHSTRKVIHDSKILDGMKMQNDGKMMVRTYSKSNIAAFLENKKYFAQDSNALAEQLGVDPKKLLVVIGGNDGAVCMPFDYIIDVLEVFNDNVLEVVNNYVLQVPGMLLALAKRFVRLFRPGIQIGFDPDGRPSMNMILNIPTFEWNIGTGKVGVGGDAVKLGGLEKLSAGGPAKSMTGPPKPLVGPDKATIIDRPKPLALTDAPKPQQKSEK